MSIPRFQRFQPVDRPSVTERQGDVLIPTDRQGPVGRWVPALALFLLGIAFRPSVVARVLSSDGVLVPTTVDALNALSAGAFAAGVVAALVVVAVSRQTIRASDLVSILTSRAGLLLLSLIGLVYVFAGARYQFNLHDEGAWIYNAMRVLNGDIPHRDFWVNYAPGQTYVLALLFKMFGPSILVERIFSRILQFLVVVLTYLLTRSLAPSAWAVVSAGVMAIWVRTLNSSSASPIVPATVLILIGCLCVAAFLQRSGSRRLMAGGVVTGVATLFRHDVGFYMFCAAVVVLFLRARAESSRHHHGPRWRLSPVVTQPAIFAAGTMVVVLPVAVLLSAIVPARDLISNLVLFPLFTYPAVHSLPILPPAPHPWRLATGELGPVEFALLTLGRFQFYFPLLALGVAAIWLWRAGRHGFSREHWFCLLLLLFGVACVNQARVRFNVTHLFPLVVPASVLWVAVACHVSRRHLLGMGLGLGLFVTSVSVSHFTARLADLATDVAPLTLERASGIQVPAAEARALDQAVRFVQQQVPADERIFVGNARHDQIFINHNMFYFLAGRHSATKYNVLESGVVTTRPVQQEIIQNLQARAKYVVIWAAEQLREPNQSGISSGVHDLDDFISSHYQPVRRFGDYVILSRREAS